METYNKRKLTAKISKMDKQLQHLETLVPNGILKDCLKEEMTAKKKSFSKNLTKNLKRQKIIPESKTEDQKVNLQNNLYIL